MNDRNERLTDLEEARRMRTAARDVCDARVAEAIKRMPNAGAAAIARELSGRYTREQVREAMRRLAKKRETSSNNRTDCETSE